MVIGAQVEALLNLDVAAGKAISAILLGSRLSDRRKAICTICTKLIHRRQLDFLAVEVVRLFPSVSPLAIVRLDFGFEIYAVGIGLLISHFQSALGLGILEFEGLLASLLQHLDTHVDPVAGQGFGLRLLVVLLLHGI